MALVAPKDTPEVVLNQLHQATAGILRQARVAQALQAMGATPLFGTRAEVEVYLRSETVKWSRVVREARIVAD